MAGTRFRMPGSLHAGWATSALRRVSTLLQRIAPEVDFVSNRLLRVLFHFREKHSVAGLSMDSRQVSNRQEARGVGDGLVAEKLAESIGALTMNDQEACVVTPIHRLPLTEDEKLSLASLRRHLGAQRRYFVAPRDLEIPPSFLQGEDVIRFDARFFTYPYGYNRLLLRKGFYQALEGHSFVLIFQLDCMALHGGLEAWVDKGYDYVGAPWFMDGERRRGECPLSVGNGGLSLRNVERAKEVLRTPIRRGAMFPKPPGNVPQPKGMEWFWWNVRRRMRQHLGMWTVEDEVENFFENEDVFWSFIAPSVCPSWRVADVAEALDFAMEENPKLCVELNGGRVPLGFHAWTKFDRAYVEGLMKEAHE